MQNDCSKMGWGVESRKGTDFVTCFSIEKAQGLPELAYRVESRHGASRNEAWYCCALLERLTATAGLGRVWVFECESLSFQAFVPANDGTVQEQGALLVHYNLNAMLVVSAIFFVIVLVVKAQGILKAGTTACNNAHPNKRLDCQVAFGMGSLEFKCSLFCYVYRHRITSKPCYERICDLDSKLNLSSRITLMLDVL
jgi:hypothetical protein